MLCRFAHNFPPFVANFLETGRGLRRRFREETITDMLMASLRALSPMGIIVDFPDEPTTGADMEWNYVSLRDNTFYRLYLQAKQLYGEGNYWSRLNYRELLYRVRGQYQARVLCDSARASGGAIYPLYAFYNPQRACDLCHAANISSIAGVNLADGYIIERLVVTARNRTLRTRNKNLKTLHPLLHPLSDLFCPRRPTRRFRFGRPPRPNDVYRCLTNWRGQLNEISGDLKELAEDLPEVPPVDKQIPPEIMTAIENTLNPAGDKGRPKLKKWRAILLSDPPDRFINSQGLFREL